jgi:hypothetical protein
MNTISYSNGKLFVAGTVNYEIDLSTGEKIPWLNGTTVNSTMKSKDNLYALSTKYLSRINTATSNFCPKPSELSLTGDGYLQRGEKLTVSDSGDVYIGFKNQISTQAYSTNESTPNFDCSIYKFDLSSSMQQTGCTKANTTDMNLFAGTPGSCYYRDGGLKSSYFRDIIDLMYDNSRNVIYVCESQAIRKIDIVKNQVSTLVGGVSNNTSISDGDRNSAKLAAVGGCFYKNNVIYFTDRSSVRRLDLNTNKISTLADGRNRNITPPNPSDGKGGAAIISQPGAITGDDEGNLYFLDRTNLFNNECSKRVENYIRKISPPEKAIFKPNIISKGTFIQDTLVCFTPINIAIYLDGTNIASGSNIEFPSTTTNSLSQPKTFEIRNLGQKSVSLQEKVFSNFSDPANSFIFGNVSPSVLQPGSSAYFTVTFNPKRLNYNYTNINVGDYANGYSQKWFGVFGNGL